MKKIILVLVVLSLLLVACNTDPQKDISTPNMERINGNLYRIQNDDGSVCLVSFDGVDQVTHISCTCKGVNQ